MSRNTEVIVIGGGAAGIAAARRLHDSGMDCILVEARQRLGGRAWTIGNGAALPIDLGCGWLHSADRNPWRAIAEARGCSIDKTLPPWTRPSPPIGFPLSEQTAFVDALRTFHGRLGSIPEEEPDRSAASFLEQGGRWNNLINAVSTYISGAEVDRISARDFSRYDDSGVNWRVVEGYGAVIAAHGGDLPVHLGCPVHRIDRSGRRLKVETAGGVIEAKAAVITLPSAVLAAEELLFSPASAREDRSCGGAAAGLGAQAISVAFGC